MPGPVDLAYISQALIDECNLIKVSVERLAQDQNRYANSFKDILENLEVIRDANDRHVNGLDIEGLYSGLSALQSEFGRLRQKCDTVVGRKGKDAPRRLVAARSIKNRKEGIVETLARLDKDIAELREAYLRESTTAAYTPAGPRAELIAGILQIKRHVERQVKLALYDAEKIAKLSGVGRLSLSEMTEAIDHVGKVSGDGDLTDLEKLYLLKKSTLLRTEVKRLADSNPSSVPSPSVEEPDSNFQDSEACPDTVIETFRIIRSLIRNSRHDFHATGADFEALQMVLTSLDLRDEVIMAMKLEVGVCRELSADAPQPELASALHRLAGRLVEMGKKEEALPYMHEAVGVHKRLAKSQPGRGLGALVSQSLQGLADCLASLGLQREALQYAQEARELIVNASLMPENDAMAMASQPAQTPNKTPDAAISKAQEAVEIGRQVTRGRPGEVLPQFASSLISYSRHLRHAGRWDEATHHIEEAVEVCRQLVRDGVGGSRPGLSNALTVAASIAAGRERHEKALEYINEAVEIQRQLAEEDATSFSLSLAHTLQSQGRRLAALGEHPEAVRSIQEAVSMWQAALGPDSSAVRPELASSLHDLSVSLYKTGKLARAARCEFDATRMFQTLVERNPDRFSPPLAISYDHLATCLADLGQNQDAMRYERSAIGILRKLIHQRPGCLRPDLARSLGNLADFLSKSKEYQEALQNIREAVKIWRELAMESPAPSLPFLARALHSLARISARARNPEKALLAARETVSTFRQLADEHSIAYDAELAGALHTLAQCLAATNQLAEGIKQNREAVALHKIVAEREPDFFLLDLALCMSDLAAYLKETRQDEEALSFATQSVDVLKRLVRTQPRLEADLAAALYALGELLGDAGKFEAALEVAKQSATLRRSLEARSPGNPKLVKSLRESVEQVAWCSDTLGLSLEGT